MDHKGDVVVYQVQKDESSCSCHVPLNFEPVEVTRNLLQNEDCTFKVVSPRLFKPWHDIKMLIPLVFKFQPPKLSLDTLQTLKQSSIVNNETPLGQALDLMVFSPGYSGKLCFKLQPGKCSASKYECNNCLTSCRPCNDSWPRPVAVMDDMVERNKSEKQGFNSSSKLLWCASPLFNKNRMKKTELVLDGFKETYLKQVKDKYGLANHQRGKWTLYKKNFSFHGKHSIEYVWQEVSLLIRKGHLPHCNSKLQKVQDEVWVYCDFQHSLKVRSILEKALKITGALHFHVHPVGVVMQL